jgi:hypothetical protein
LELLDTKKWVPALSSTTTTTFSSSSNSSARMPNMFTQAAATTAMYANASAHSSSNRAVRVINEKLQEDEDDELQPDEVEEEITGAPRFLFQVR